MAQVSLTTDIHFITYWHLFFTDNNAWWVQFFNARRNNKLRSTEWLVRPPMSRNREGRAHF
jgi:hypothetical protein